MGRGGIGGERGSRRVVFLHVVDEQRFMEISAIEWVLASQNPRRALFLSGRPEDSAEDERQGSMSD